MIAIDTNVLLAAHRRDSPHYAFASRALHGLVQDAMPWCIPEPCVSEFLAGATHIRNFSPPSSVEQAAAQIDAWLAAPSAILLTAGPKHWATLRQLVVAAQLRGGQMHDARIAAICLERGVTTIWTADRDFARFAPLKAVNPLVDAAYGKT